MYKVQSARHAALAVAVAMMLVATLALPPLEQSPAYHLMADGRPFLGIPNCLNVLSNIAFALAGLLGLWVVFRREDRGVAAFDDRWERWPYTTLFAGSLCTAFGSAYYHLEPDNWRLVWDRLPMTLGFAGLLAAVLAERFNRVTARRLFPFLVALGAGSVAYWYWSELHGGGDLRFYALVQFGYLLVIIMLLLMYPPQYPGTGFLVTALAAYATSKGLELADYRIFAIGQVVSGHTLKHFVAAGAVACVAAMLRSRRPTIDPTPGVH